MKAYIELIEKDNLPYYANQGDAGMDIRASEDIVIKPRETKIVKTGVKIAVPEGVHIDVRPRSGLSSKTPLRICNAPGTIDCKYRGEIGIIVQNTSLPFTIDDDMNIIKNDKEYTIDTEGNKEGTYIIKKGDRIAQLVFLQNISTEFEVIDNILDIEGNRGGGFGSSGTN